MLYSAVILGRVLRATRLLRFMSYPAYHLPEGHLCSSRYSTASKYRSFNDLVNYEPVTTELFISLNSYLLRFVRCSVLKYACDSTARVSDLEYASHGRVLGARRYIRSCDAFFQKFHCFFNSSAILKRQPITQLKCCHRFLDLTTFQISIN